MIMFSPSIGAVFGRFLVVSGVSLLFVLHLPTGSPREVSPSMLHAFGSALFLITKERFSVLHPARQQSVHAHSIMHTAISGACRFSLHLFQAFPLLGKLQHCRMPGQANQQPSCSFHVPFGCCVGRNKCEPELVLLRRHLKHYPAIPLLVLFIFSPFDVLFLKIQKLIPLL